MKMSRPTKVTMTSMTAVRGSSTQPELEPLVASNWNQLKLKTWTESGLASAAAKAQSGEQGARAAMEPMARAAAGMRLRCFRQCGDSGGQEWAARE